MAAPDSAPRSPSPAPSAPTQTTPGARAAKLADVYRGALGATLRSCSYENFAACFPTPAQRTPTVLRAVWEQVCGKIEAKGQAEFEQICDERHVVPQLNALETLLAEARARKEAAGGRLPEGAVPPHQLPPHDLLAAHLAPELATMQTQLETQLAARQARNAELATQITAQRAAIERIVAGLETAVADLEGANGVLEAAVDGPDEKSVRAEVRELRAAEAAAAETAASATAGTSTEDSQAGQAAGAT